MTQDNANQPKTAEEPQSSDQSHAMQADSENEQSTTETQVAKPVLEEVEDELAEEEEETDDASDETVDAEVSSPSDSANSVTTPTPAAPEADVDERSEIEKQPYDFDHCTVQIAIQLLPDDGDVNGRMVVVGVRSHLDSPLLRLVRLNELGPLPALVGELLDALKADLPTREQAAREAFEKKKEEKAKRKATVTASKTARGKKTKATLATAPASSNATTDNRPRPEVQATTAPQQQMGLF